MTTKIRQTSTSIHTYIHTYIKYHSTINNNAKTLISSKTVFVCFFVCVNKIWENLSSTLFPLYTAVSLFSSQSMNFIVFVFLCDSSKYFSYKISFCLVNETLTYKDISERRTDNRTNCPSPKPNGPLTSSVPIHVHGVCTFHDCPWSQHDSQYFRCLNNRVGQRCCVPTYYRYV